jgi:hypothetical protein
MDKMVDKRGVRASERHGYHTSDRERVAHVKTNVVWLVRRMYVAAWGWQDRMHKEGVTVNADPDEVLRAEGPILIIAGVAALLQWPNRPWGSESRSTKR